MPPSQLPAMKKLPTDPPTLLLLEVPAEAMGETRLTMYVGKTAHRCWEASALRRDSIIDWTQGIITATQPALLVVTGCTPALGLAEAITGPFPGTKAVHL
jgi:hypothetical protein